MDGCSITPYENGPLIIRGDFNILDQDGNEIERRRKTVALCRCGHSKIRPFCDGTHRPLNFRAEGGAEDPRRSAPGGSLDPLTSVDDPASEARPDGGPSGDGAFDQP